MITLLISLAVLIGGYFVYGLIADRVFGSDPSRPTPAMTDGGSPSTPANDISVSWLGTVGGVLAVLGVVAAPITTGDTALFARYLVRLRSLRTPDMAE